MKRNEHFMITIILLLFILNSAQAQYNYYSGNDYDTDGVPTCDNFTSGTGNPSAIDSVINNNLSEGIAANLSNTNVFKLDYNLQLTEDAAVYISYASEDAGNHNSLGFYTYTGDTPTQDDLNNKQILFPNVESSCLSDGDQLYLGNYPSGTKFGWFVVPDGWNNGDNLVDSHSTFETLYSTVSLNSNDNIQCVYINADYNPESSDISHVLLAFEDIPLDDSSCDNDYNDVLFYISTYHDYSLPVELSSFKGHIKNNATELSWITESEHQNRGFILERRKNDESWITIGSYLNSRSLIGQNNSTQPTNYQFTDGHISPGNNYEYRLTDVDESNNKNVHKDQVIKINYEENLSVADNFKISRIYPNPFNPRTTIRYNLNKRQHIQLNIYDESGRLIEQLWSGVKNSGVHRLTFDASDYSSGIYLIHLTNGSQVSIQKCVFMK